MEGILKNIRLFAREKEDREAMEQYRDLLRDLELLRDEDLVESYIYESNALAARYRFLLREAKKQKSRLGNQKFPIGITE